MRDQVIQDASGSDDKTSLLQRLTYAVEDWMTYFKGNNDRYYKAIDFIYNTSISKNEAAILQNLSRPQIQAVVLEAHLDHLRGEFSDNTPSPIVQPAAGDPQLAPQAEVVENHFRYIFDTTKDVQLKVFDGQMIGFGNAKVVTKYVNSKDLNQYITLENVHDNTLVGYDPLARQIHKGDGKYSFEIYPKSKEEVEKEYDVTLEQIEFNSLPSDGFSWFFSQGFGKQRQKVVMICDFYEKEITYKMFYLISDPTHPDNQITMLREDYKKMLKELEEQGVMIAPPKILKKVKREEVKIKNYVFIGNQILEEIDLPEWESLPHVYFDGKSANMRDGKQMTRSYAYHAFDIQKAKNVCLQNIINEIENARQTDIIIPKEALPSEEEYQQGWINPQKAQGALVYNQFSENPTQSAPLNAPNVIQRAPVSSAVIQMYQIADQTIQAILGNYDAQQGQQNDMSGVAIENGASQSNKAASKLWDNYQASMNQVLKIMVSLFPKYFTTARSIPVIDKNGNRTFTKINDTIENPTYKIEYDMNDLLVEVKMDANFEVQRNRLLKTLLSLMQAVPQSQFVKFMNSPDGIGIILDNCEVKDIALVKEKFSKFVQMDDQKMQQQQQMAQQTNPEMNKMRMAQMQAQEKDKDRKVDLIGTFIQKNLDDKKLQAQQSETEAKVLIAQTEAIARLNSAQAEEQRTQLESAMKLDAHFYDQLERERKHGLDKHDRAVDLIKLMGELNHGQSQNQSENENVGSSGNGQEGSQGQSENQEEIGGGNADISADDEGSA